MLNIIWAVEKKKNHDLVGVTLFFTGLILLLIPHQNITGAVIGFSANFSMLNYIGVFFILVSAILFAATPSGLEKITLKSSIHSNTRLKRLAEDATNNQRIQQEIDHLAYELKRGNLEAGLGTPGHLSKTDVFYLRGRNGGRLYYRKAGYGYEIVGKSSKGRNQDQVIEEIEKAYSH
jgi:hypothetical protein